MRKGTTLEEHPIWYHYRLLAPVREKYTDDDTQVVARLPLQLDQETIGEIALIGSAEAPESIRVRFPHPDGRYSDEIGKSIVRASEYMLTVLRITYDHDVDFATYKGQHVAILTPSTKSGGPGLSVAIGLIENANRSINPDHIVSTFSTTYKVCPVFNLLADSFRHSLPLQYQFLSLYKILEHEFRAKNKWNGLDELLGPFDEEFHRLSSADRSLKREVHDLRNKCAHIKIGKWDQPGIAGVGSRDAERVSKVLPLLRRIVTEHLMTKYGLAPVA